jgi:hypothetical protein
MTARLVLLLSLASLCLSQDISTLARRIKRLESAKLAEERLSQAKQAENHPSGAIVDAKVEAPINAATQSPEAGKTAAIAAGKKIASKPAPELFSASRTKGGPGSLNSTKQASFRQKNAKRGEATASANSEQIAAKKTSKASKKNEAQKAEKAQKTEASRKAQKAGSQAGFAPVAGGDAGASIIEVLLWLIPCSHA